MTPAGLDGKGSVGIGWRPELDLTIEHLGVDFVEVVADDLDPRRIPESLASLRTRGAPVLPHAVSLSLGGAEQLDTARLQHLGALAEALDAPLVSDHVAFVRAGGLEAGHLLPIPRTKVALGVLVSNVRAAQTDLPVPLAVENIAALLDWPEAEMTEEQFLAELVERTGCLLIVDVANLFANAVNLGTQPERFLDEIPLDHLAYVHVGGGRWQDGRYHDTHADPVPSEVFGLLGELCRRTTPPGVLLERDGRFPTDTEINGELEQIRAVTRQWLN